MIETPLRQPFRVRGRAEARAAGASPGTVAPPEEAHFLSPSLLVAEGAPAAYEVKFRIALAEAGSVEAWAREHLALDPHADASLGGAYRVHTLYLDTDGLDIYHRTRHFRRRKYRVRRYGSGLAVFLERKSKSRGRVRKQRVGVCPEDLYRLQEASADEGWPGGWFHAEILDLQLAPRCLTSYDRTAFFGTAGGEPVRLTLDRGVRCALADEYRFGTARAHVEVLPGEAVLELKFGGSLPVLFKRLIEGLRLCPSDTSKYRRATEALGLGCKEAGAG